MPSGISHCRAVSSRFSGAVIVSRFAASDSCACKSHKLRGSSCRNWHFFLAEALSPTGLQGPHANSRLPAASPHRKNTCAVRLCASAKVSSRKLGQSNVAWPCRTTTAQLSMYLDLGVWLLWIARACSGRGQRSFQRRLREPFKSTPQVLYS